jgi:hypothetical protein
MSRFIFTASLFVFATLSQAQAGNFGCNPAIQNWVNGSKTTCPYDSHTTAPQLANTSPAPSPPPVVVTETPPEDDGE